MANLLTGIGIGLAVAGLTLWAMFPRALPALVMLAFVSTLNRLCGRSWDS